MSSRFDPPAALLLYRIDATDRLVEVGGAWHDFARANAGRGLDAETVIGRLLWDYIGDPTTQQLYRAMVRQVRADALPVRFQFRCDSPTMRRLLAMEVTALADGHVQFGVARVREESRATVPLLEGVQGIATDRVVTMCSWCQDVKVPVERWVAVEEAVSLLGLFAEATTPLLSHGICPNCNAQLTEMLNDADLSVGGSVTLGSW